MNLGGGFAILTCHEWIREGLKEKKLLERQTRGMVPIAVKYVDEGGQG